MNELGPWNTDDFDDMSWHDAHVHGFWMDNFDEGNGEADLILDIDFILEWPRARASDEGAFSFKVCQALLRFHDVMNLKIYLDYNAPAAGTSPFSLSGVERELRQFPTGNKAYHWRLPVNWPSGLLEFTASGFTQTLVGAPSIETGQHLAAEKRLKIAPRGL